MTVNIGSKLMSKLIFQCMIYGLPIHR